MNYEGLTLFITHHVSNVTLAFGHARNLEGNDHLTLVQKKT